MSNENSKIREIRRLTTPITFKGSKAYDSDGNRVNCIETMSEIKYIIEPEAGILSDDEILKYAPDSSYASKIKFQRGLGSASDLLHMNYSIIGILAAYYMFLICVLVPYAHWGNRVVMFIILILSIIPLAYLYKSTNSKSSPKIESKAQKTVASPSVSVPIHEDMGLESLKKYKNEINSLKSLFDIKEEIVKDLIEKSFAPPQFTYDRFMSIIGSAHKLFYNQHDSALNIINLAAEDTPRIESEVEGKISNMKAIIDQIEDLTNELVIYLSSDDQTSDDVKNLLGEMENLIGSVKEY